MARTSIFRSPFFWGAVGVAAVGVGAVFHHKRQALLGRGRAAGPEPVLVKKNPAKIPAPTAVTKVGGHTAKLYVTDKFSIDQRLKLIQEQVWNGVQDGRIRHLAGQITKDCGRDDGECEVKQVFAAVRSHVRYSGDVGPVVNPKTGVVEGMDMYATPYRTWTAQIGDCDDHVALIAALLAIMGHTVRLRVTAPTRLGDFAHIYPAVGTPKNDPRRFRAVDTTLPGRAGVGSEASYGRARDYLVEVPA